MVVPSLPPLPGLEPLMGPLRKDAMRKAAMDARKQYARGLSDAERAQLEERLAGHLTALLAGSKVVAGYAPMRSEISPLVAMEEAIAVGAIAAFPAFDHPSKPFRFRAGQPSAPGPFGMMQPAGKAPVVEPDLILVPLVAIDRAGTRLGRGKGHYDAALARLRKGGAKLVGIGWPQQLIEESIPADAWDVPLDGFASPEGLTWFKR